MEDMTVPARSRATAVALKAVPNIVVAAVIPAVGFIVGKHLWGLAGAIIVVLVWNGGCQLIRRLAGRAFSVLLVISLAELVLRSVLSLVLGSAQVFFVIPSVITAVTGAVFVATAFTSRPLLAGVMFDLVPASVLDRTDRRMMALLAKASMLYGAEQMLIAAISILMAVNLPATTYAAVHPPVSWAVLGVTVTTAGVLLRRQLRALLPKNRPSVDLRRLAPLPV